MPKGPNFFKIFFLGGWGQGWHSEMEYKEETIKTLRITQIEVDLDL